MEDLLHELLIVDKGESATAFFFDEGMKQVKGLNFVQLLKTIFSMLLSYEHDNSSLSLRSDRMEWEKKS